MSLIFVVEVKISMKVLPALLEFIWSFYFEEGSYKAPQESNLEVTKAEELCLAVRDDWLPRPQERTVGWGCSSVEGCFSQHAQGLDLIPSTRMGKKKKKKGKC